MDGVLIEAKDWHYEALNRALALFGFEISRYDHLVTYDGLPTKRKLEMLTMERGLPEPLHGFLNDLKQIYTMEIVQREMQADVSTMSTRFPISKRKGYKLAVASNSVRSSVVEVMMQKASLTPYLDALMSNQDVTKGKPDPEIYTATIAKLGLSAAGVHGRGRQRQRHPGGAGGERECDDRKRSA